MQVTRKFSTEERVERDACCAKDAIFGMPLVYGSCRANKSRDICDF